MWTLLKIKVILVLILRTQMMASATAHHRLLGKRSRVIGSPSSARANAYQSALKTVMPRADATPLRFPTASRRNLQHEKPRVVLKSPPWNIQEKKLSKAAIRTVVAAVTAHTTLPSKQKKAMGIGATSASSHRDAPARLFHGGGRETGSSHRYAPARLFHGRGWRETGRKTTRRGGGTMLISTIRTDASVATDLLKDAHHRHEQR